LLVKDLKASQVYFNPPAFTDHVWVNIKLQGSDSLLVGCIYHSPSDPLNASVTSLYELLETIPICLFVVILTLRKYFGLTTLDPLAIVISNPFLTL